MLPGVAQAHMIWVIYCVELSTCFIVLQERRIGQLEKVLAELYVFIDEQSAAGELLVDDEEKYLERVKAKEAGEFINLDGFVGMSSSYNGIFIVMIN